MAAAKGHLEVMKLLSSAKANLEAADADGREPSVGWDGRQKGAMLLRIYWRRDGDGIPMRSLAELLSEAGGG